MSYVQPLIDSCVGPPYCTPSKIQTVPENSSSVFSEHWSQPAKVGKYSINYTITFDFC